MARKVLKYTETGKGRDRGKVFVLTEMPATRAEKWGIRALLALARAGVDIPPDIAQAGLAGVAAIGIQALNGLPFDMLEPLLDEMFTCVEIMPDAKHPDVVRKLVADDIEEIPTLFKLRKAIFTLHIEFFTNASGQIRDTLAALTPGSSTT